MNPYLVRQRAKYEQLTGAAETILNTAAAENRDMNEAEARSVETMSEQAKGLIPEIERLTDLEVRSRQVATLAASIADARPETEVDGGAAQTRSAETENLAGTETRTSTTTAKDRDPGHYRRGGQHSFFADVFHARSLQEVSANDRLVEHNRALDMAGEGPGVIPPVWMTEEFESLARQLRKVASAVRNVPLSSAAPISMPKQTAGTDANVTAQSAEGANNGGWFTDSFDTDVTPVQPAAISGGQDVSRQMLDSGNPAVDELIFTDLTESYNLKIEALVVAAMIAAAGSAVVTYANEAAWTTGLNPTVATSVIDAIAQTALAVRQARKLPADILITSVGRYGSLLSIKDSTGRPLIPGGSAGLQNVRGRGDVAVDGFLDTANVSLLATDGVPATYAESLVAARSYDTILFESPVRRFSYEQPNGPSAVRLGIWSYAAAHVKHAGKSTKRLVITAAS